MRSVVVTLWLKMKMGPEIIVLVAEHLLLVIVRKHIHDLSVMAVSLPIDVTCNFIMRVRQVVNEMINAVLVLILNAVLDSELLNFLVSQLAMSIVLRRCWLGLLLLRLGFLRRLGLQMVRFDRVTDMVGCRVHCYVMLCLGNRVHGLLHKVHDLVGLVPRVLLRSQLLWIRVESLVVDWCRYNIAVLLAVREMRLPSVVSLMERLSRRGMRGHGRLCHRMVVMHLEYYFMCMLDNMSGLSYRLGSWGRSSSWCGSRLRGSLGSRCWCRSRCGSLWSRFLSNGRLRLGLERLRRLLPWVIGLSSVLERVFWVMGCIWARWRSPLFGSRSRLRLGLGRRGLRCRAGRCSRCQRLLFRSRRRSFLLWRLLLILVDSEGMLSQVFDCFNVVLHLTGRVIGIFREVVLARLIVLVLRVMISDMLSWMNVRVIVMILSGFIVNIIVV